MGNSIGHRTAGLRAVGETPARRRGPGAAVFAVLLYAALFAGGLWLLRGRSPLLRKTSRGQPAPTAARPAVTRAALLAGTGLTPAGRDEYFRQLSSECCVCGCDLNVRDCLLSDQACTRSPQQASLLLEKLR